VEVLRESLELERLRNKSLEGDMETMEAQMSDLSNENKLIKEDYSQRVSKIEELLTSSSQNNHQVKNKKGQKQPISNNSHHIEEKLEEIKELLMP